MFAASLTGQVPRRTNEQIKESYEAHKSDFDDLLGDLRVYVRESAVRKYRDGKLGARHTSFTYKRRAEPHFNKEKPCQLQIIQPTGPRLPRHRLG
jgi:hypothetical protein